MAQTIPGILLSNMNYKPATYDPATYDPTLWNVDDKQTVSGQLQGILSGNSPLLQQAGTRALQSANAKGLANSSMAVTAGQSALYDAALPIAQADAATHSSAAQTNVAAQNTAAQTNAAAQNTAWQANTNAANSLIGTQMQEANKLQLANIEADYKTLMQVNASSGELYQQSVKNITDIIGNTDLDAEAKDAAISQQLGYLKDGLEMFGAMNNLNLTKLLNF